jgi:hypothetical protein
MHGLGAVRISSRHYRVAIGVPSILLHGLRDLAQAVQARVCDDAVRRQATRIIDDDVQTPKPGLLAKRVCSTLSHRDIALRAAAELPAARISSAS